MDFIWMAKHKNDQIKIKGQTLVEYVLILGMLALIGVSIFKSDAFKGIFGEDSLLFEKLNRKMSYEYRHGASGSVDRSNNNYGGNHETYYINGKTRFFIGVKPYPP